MATTTNAKPAVPAKGAAATVTVANDKATVAKAFATRLDKRAGNIAASFQEFDAATTGTTAFNAAMKLAKDIGFTPDDGAVYRNTADNPMEVVLRHAVDIAVPDRGFAAAKLILERLGAAVNLSTDETVKAARLGFTDSGLAYAGVKDIPAKNAKWKLPGSNDDDGSPLEAVRNWLESLEDGNEYLDAVNEPLALIRIGKRLNAAKQYGVRIKQTLVLPWIEDLFSGTEEDENGEPAVVMNEAAIGKWRTVAAKAWAALVEDTGKASNTYQPSAKTVKDAVIAAARKEIGVVSSLGRKAESEAEIKSAAVIRLVNAIKHANKVGLVNDAGAQALREALKGLGIQLPGKAKGGAAASTATTATAPAEADDTVTDDTEIQDDGANDATVLEEEDTGTEEEDTGTVEEEEIEAVAPPKTVPLPARSKPVLPRGK